MDDERITDPAKIAAYVKSARALYQIDQDFPMEFPDPAVVVKTPSGAKVMAWLSVEEEDLQA